MWYAQLREDGRWYAFHEDGGDGYLTPAFVFGSKADAERWIREAQPSFWADAVVVTEEYIGPSFT